MQWILIIEAAAWSFNLQIKFELEKYWCMRKCTSGIATATWSDYTWINDLIKMYSNDLCVGIYFWQII